MKKVEVVIEAVYLNRLIELYAKNGIDRYTIFKDIEGAGGMVLRWLMTLQMSLVMTMYCPYVMRRSS